VAFTPKGAADDSTPVGQLHFDFFFGQAPGLVDLTTASSTLSPEPVLGEGGCGPNNFPLRSNARVSGALSAVDWAGNRSVATTPRPLKGCGCSSTGTVLPLALLGLLGRQRRRRSEAELTLP
jgi:uncharacterized protein (TIGR03382 family)